MLLDDGTIAVSVGDVVGHGLSAATAMGQLRNAIRAYLLEDISPGQILRRLNRFARTMGEVAFSTCVLATLDPSRPIWRFASAGHPPPLVVADGGARLLELRGPPVGALDDFDYDEPAARDLLVAIGEAATDAIEHPRDSTKALFRVEGRLGDGELVVRVSDSGRWCEPSLPTDRGRGLAFMRKLVSDVEVVESDGGTAVVLRQDLRDRSRERNR
jgi:anti-sigma regulatory factor (Ser/Thr protein kinase)